MSAIQPSPLTHKLKGFQGRAHFYFSFDLMTLYINHLMQFCFDLPLLFLVILVCFRMKEANFWLHGKHQGSQLTEIFGIRLCVFILR